MKQFFKNLFDDSNTINVIVLGAFGIASVDKFINKRKGNE